MTDVIRKERFDELTRLAHAAGLRPYPVHFFEVPADIIYQVASYGLPTRFSHWSFGRHYSQQKSQGEMGFSKIYELILNNSPSYAFLDKTNTETGNLLICAHCVAHSDFFANNIMFKQCGETNMVQVAKRHAEDIDQFRKDYGDDEVDLWLDIALALERHIDVFKGRRRCRYPQRKIEYKERSRTKWEDLVDINESKSLTEKVVHNAHIPPYPEKDILWFLSEYANLEDWQKRIFEIVRRESYYFFAQFATKIANEGWSCVSANTRIHTSSGFIKAYDIVKGDGKENIFSGELFEKRSNVYTTRRKDGFQIRTNTGLVFSCAKNHKVMLYDGSFVTADRLKVGDKLKEANIHTWDAQPQIIESTYIPAKYSNGKEVIIDKKIVVDEEFARFVAFWIGEGSRSKNRTLKIRNSDRSILIFLGNYIKKKFGINFSINRVNDDGHERYDLWVHSRALFELMHSITGCVTCTAKKKSVPDCIFRSPASVIISFLRSVFDAEGCVYLKEEKKQRSLIFASSSINFISEIALLLSAFGVRGRYNRSKKKGYDDGYQLRISDKRSLTNFFEKIGCNDQKKYAKLCKLIKSINTKSHWIQPKTYTIVKEIHPIKDVFYDFTMPKSHQYVANGLIHHNSYFHAELMHQYAMGNDNDYGVKDIKYPLTPEEHLDFVSMHEKVVQPGVKIPLKVDEVDEHGRKTGTKVWNPLIIKRPHLFNLATRLNPYYVGYRMWHDIKKRWDKYFEQGYMEDEWGEKIPVTINGNQKIREVMESEDDVSFLRNYLTEELAEELHLFGYGSTDEYNDNYEVQNSTGKSTKSSIDQTMIDQIIKNKTVAVQSKNLEDIINTFAKAHANYGVPLIVVRRVDSDGTLRLEHLESDNVNIDIRYGEHVLKYIGKAWGRPAELIRKDTRMRRCWIVRYDGRNVSVDYDNLDHAETLESADEDSYV